MDPSDTDTMTRGGPPGSSAGFDSEGGRLDDRALIDNSVAALVSENRARASRLDAVSRFHARRVAEIGQRRSAAPGYFLLTPLQATKAEFAPLLGLSELCIQIDLDLTDTLKELFPGIWRRCLEGRLDIGRARLAYDQLSKLTNDADKKAFAELVEEFLDKVDDPRSPVCTISRQSLRQAVRRRCLKFPQKDPNDSFPEQFEKRRVSLRTDEDGMATLTAVTAVHDAMAADYRLTLIAKKLRQAEGEARTLDQLRVDALIDLIHGRLTVEATARELEDDEMADGRDPAETFTRKESVGSYARPVINVTVPITTLIGLSDDPGVMAGGVTIPAELAQMIAMHPEASWYRMLTDPAGNFVELSTESYAPTEPICRWCVARDVTCVWPGCSRPASIIEFDHRVRFPFGKTSTRNIQCLCRRHHMVKHSEGFEVVLEEDGSFTWTSRFGSVFRTPAPEMPVAFWPAVVGEEGNTAEAAAFHGTTPEAAGAGAATAAAPGEEEGADLKEAFASIVEREFGALIARSC